MEPDECVQRYERAVLMTVYGVGLALQRTPPEALQESREVWSSLLAEKRVWKLARHGNPQVRVGWLDVHTVRCIVLCVLWYSVVFFLTGST